MTNQPLTPTKHPKRLIWFCETEKVADDPDVLGRLRDTVGLTTIMPESHVCHTSGFGASEEISRRGPFEDWRSRSELWPRGKDGIYPPVAGTVGGFDDDPLLRLIQGARKAGIEVWGHLGLWSYGGDVYPELALQDLEGRPLDHRYRQWGIGLCPSRRQVIDWVRDCLVDVARRYELDGFCVDHARYPAPASVHALMACGCEACQSEAQRLGEDFGAMRDGVLKVRSQIRSLRADDLRRLEHLGAGLTDMATLLEGGAEALRWLRFRARILAERMGEFRDAVRDVDAGLVFGSDVFAPSISLLGGHDYRQWEKVTDYLTGGSSQGGVVGWATGATNAAREWSGALCRTVEGVGEATALRLMYRLLGLDGLCLPEGVEALEKQAPPVAELYGREIDRLQTYTTGRVPLYPPISATGGPEQVRQLCRAVVEGGCDGAMLGLDPGRSEILEILGEELGRL